ncbi:MAG TPA: hypothetical protein VK797_05925 [Tepidisphaeraceae bacterium]|nr:hypothetical protein [Tepidisphaeraceae bacterium]
MNQVRTHEIVTRLGKIERRHWKVNFAITSMRTGVVLLLVFLAGAMLLGTANGLSSPLYAAIAAGVWVIAGRFIAAAIRDSSARLPLVTVARQIERQRSDIEERISSAVQLCQDASFTGSAALLARLVGQAESCAAGLAPRQLVSLKPAFLWTAWALMTLMTWGVIYQFPATHRTAAIGLSRLVAPMRQSPRGQVQTEPPAANAPELTNLPIHYDYPPYTALASHTVRSSDGVVDAVVGTRVTINVRTSRALSAAKSALLIAGLPPIPLVRSAEGQNAYAAHFTVHNDSSYAIQLTDALTPASRQEPPRPIHARPDQVPSIVLQSPEPQASVRPDDIVPIQFLAADDFGVARIDMLLRVDNHEPRVMPVPFDKADPRHVAGPAFALAVDDILTREKLASATQITYRFRVADNRDPDPQLSTSAPQILRIDENSPRSFVGQQEQQLAAGLQEILQNVVHELDRAAARVSRARTRDGTEPLGEWQGKELHQAATDLTAMDKGLARAADQAADSVFARIAADIKQSADGPLRQAAEEASRADAESDDWKQRDDALAGSLAAIASSRPSLQKLLEGQGIERLRGMSEAARDLASAAKLEHTGRKELARKRLEQAFDQAPSLREQNPSDALRQAAQAAQAAEQSQDNGAFEQAAGELQLAASSLARSLSVASMKSPKPQASAQVAHTPKPIAARGTSLSGPVPAAVRDLGLSADDWARLPALAQRDLLNTAQQTPPPEYREMVRDYFVKLARMHGQQDDQR